MSDDEDYMSNAFLANIDDVKPGISDLRERRRLLRINAHSEEAVERQRMEKPKSKDELERNRLIEGLSNPIRTESKGFQLLAKMGYREGMSLGRSVEDAQRNGSGAREPISIQVRTDRSGVGMDEHRREKQRDLCEAHMERMKRRANIEEELARDFRKRKRSAMETKQLVSEIQKLRKTCHEMDIRSDKRLPAEYWFWPIYCEKELNGETADETNHPSEGTKRGESCAENGEGMTQRYTYANGEEAPMEMDLQELDNPSLEESLNRIIDYLRKEYFYCLYCGCAFSSPEELGDECPGTSREDHE